MRKSFKPIAAPLSAALLAVSLIPAASADVNPFSANLLSSGHEPVNRGSDAEGSGGEGQCGEGQCGEGQCGEGQCGELSGSEGSCGEGQCGELSGSEGSCGEGQCGEDK